MIGHPHRSLRTNRRSRTFSYMLQTCWFPLDSDLRDLRIGNFGPGSKDVWMLTGKFWDQDPSAWPHSIGILTLLETASRGWVSPTSEAIASLNLGRPASKNHPTPVSADTISDRTWDVRGRDVISREADIGRGGDYCYFRSSPPRCARLARGRTRTIN